MSCGDLTRMGDSQDNSPAHGCMPHFYAMFRYRNGSAKETSYHYAAHIWIYVWIGRDKPHYTAPTRHPHHWCMQWHGSDRQAAHSPRTRKTESDCIRCCECGVENPSFHMNRRVSVPLWRRMKIIFNAWNMLCYICLSQCSLHAM